MKNTITIRGVTREGVEGIVLEQFLDVVHVRAGTQELGGAGAAEGVRAHTFFRHLFHLILLAKYNHFCRHDCLLECLNVYKHLFFI